jgi:hypothetical protein
MPRKEKATKPGPESVTDVLAQLRAELRACSLEDRVAEAVAKFPPISVERAIKIADLLVRGAADHAVLEFTQTRKDVA